MCNNLEEPVPAPRINKPLTLAELRVPARFFVRRYPPDGRILFRAAHLDSALLQEANDFLDRLFADRDELEQTFSFQLNEATMLRVVPLDGGLAPSYAVFLEPMRRRISLDDSVKRYSLTPRETDILRLIVSAKTTREIAAQLFITAATVNDHTASLFRKLGVRRRSEAVARVLHLEHDIEFITKGGLGGGTPARSMTGR